MVCLIEYVASLALGMGCAREIPQGFGVLLYWLSQPRLSSVGVQCSGSTIE